MKKILIILTAALLSINSALLLADDDLFTIPSAHDVKTTMDRFEQAVISAGFNVFARIDHQENALSAGLKMPASQLLIFGNPKAGTLLMQDNPRIGVALPLKVLVWEDEQGIAWLSYVKPKDLFDEFDIENRDKMLNKMTAGLKKLSTKATIK